MLALARRPPADGAALADVPGVGSALAERWGGAILGALADRHGTRLVPRLRLRASGPGHASGQGGCRSGDAYAMQGGPRRRRTRALAHGVAGGLGVPQYVVLRNTALAALAACDARDGRALAAFPGMGPRALAKHGEALLRLIAAHPPDHYLLPMDQSDAGRQRFAAERRRSRPAGSRRSRSWTWSERRATQCGACSGPL